MFEQIPLIHVRVSTEERKAIKHLVAEKEITMQEWLRTVILEALAKEGK